LTDSEEQDQLYEVENGEPIFRSYHQARTMLHKLALPAHARILDFGCAKGATAKRAMEARSDLAMHLFDVSDRYLPFWNRFLASDRFATFETPNSWQESFDAVASFFVLEHVSNPVETLLSMRNLLKSGGLLYFVVPNPYANIGDFVIADHTHHYSKESIENLLVLSGFEMCEIDDSSHRASFVVTARKIETADAMLGYAVCRHRLDKGERNGALRVQVNAIAGYWDRYGTDVRAFEDLLPLGSRTAIYGAGFYGTFLLTCLANPERVVCFMDRDPYLQGECHRGRPVFSPEALPDGVDTVYIGVNPDAATDIPNMSCWRGRDMRFFVPRRLAK